MNCKLISAHGVTLRYTRYITRIGMVNMSKRQQTHLDNNINPRPPNERRGSPHTKGHAADVPINIIHI